MARPIPESKLQAIVEAVTAHPQGAGIHNIESALPESVARRTLQYRLNKLVTSGRIVKEGSGRWSRYHPVLSATTAQGIALPLSGAALEIQRYVRRPLTARKLVGYERSFPDSYKPNHSAMLDDREREHLTMVGTQPLGATLAGTFAKHILNRLLVDLSWNSSRLEGNTYSLLETQRLIDFGVVAESKAPMESQMILNHRDAVTFLVDEAANIGFNRHTILDLHALLSDNLLADPQASGRLRYIPVGIAKSVFHPLENPQRIEECFAKLLTAATAISNPFEQALFVLAHIPYLQPFDDVNKRVSRLAANIPLIKANLAPLSFVDVPADIYTEAMLGVYELRRTELLRDVFIYAYRRSAQRYAVVQQSIGEPDPFILQHRAALRDLVQSIVRRKLNRQSAWAHIAAYAERHIDPAAQDRFRQTAERELLSLHEGNFVRYRITPPQFEAWQQAWNSRFNRSGRSSRFV